MTRVTTGRRSSRKQGKPGEESRWLLLRWFVGAVGCISALLGIVGFSLSFLNSIRIEAPSFNAKNPSYAKFVITNEGPLSIRLVQVLSRVDHLRYPGLVEFSYMRSSPPQTLRYGYFNIMSKRPPSFPRSSLALTWGITHLRRMLGT